MGSLLSMNLEANYKKNQAFIDEMMSTAMERQFQAQNAMMEFLNWVAAFYVTAATGLITGFRKTKKPVLMVLLVPLGFVVTYYWDLAYGTKMDRILLDAENVLAEERARLGIPYGLPTYQVIEKSLRTKEELAQDTERQLQAASKYKIVPFKLSETIKPDV